MLNLFQVADPAVPVTEQKYNNPPKYKICPAVPAVPVDVGADDAVVRNNDPVTVVPPPLAAIERPSTELVASNKKNLVAPTFPGMPIRQSAGDVLRKRAIGSKLVVDCKVIATPPSVMNVGPLAHDLKAASVSKQI